ncbi:unnamed protein product [Polarella glacialis]|uniref:Uncharacterized protein n=1 Tax=Polarella glacialis TaxID=89957 RepID=A0A813FCH5_POLGL|nr:unnamed protein product [Polarella glacialis]
MAQEPKELAAKLQRTLERYRGEKVRGAELARRLEDSLKEASRGRGLERSLEELQQGAPGAEPGAAATAGRGQVARNDLLCLPSQRSTKEVGNIPPDHKDTGEGHHQA